MKICKPLSSILSMLIPILQGRKLQLIFSKMIESMIGKSTSYTETQCLSHYVLYSHLKSLKWYN